ncbi:hypothetical protein F4X88_03910 [Candidatus Poribacteria bacterium]|nr:hypothetical protein [Candidatus Poribacteria bacterium]MYA55420.1 hypothetical protein [Candidatus Poribacteria bacterium]
MRRKSIFLFYSHYSSLRWWFKNENNTIDLPITTRTLAVTDQVKNADVGRWKSSQMPAHYAKSELAGGSNREV